MLTPEQTKEFYDSPIWRKKRNQIRERDNHECQWCKDEGKLTLRKDALLIVHHIIELKHDPSLRLRDDNLILICFECHERHHGRWVDNGNRWSDERW